MGTLIGHVAPGFGFLLIVLYHLFNNTKLHSLRPSSYTSPPWFHRLELLLIIAGSSLSIAMELFIAPQNHHPLDPSDLTIPSNHLHNVEHASISLSFLSYAAFSLLLRRLRHPSSRPITLLLAAAAFSQQLLLFRLHSSDHMGVEGHYHSLLQLLIAVSLSTTLLSIPFPNSFPVAFVRSSSIAFQGIWFIIMGVVLWTPALVFKGCFMNPEDGHTVVRCRTDADLHRAKSLVNIQFSWVMAGVTAVSVASYVCITRMYPPEPDYLSLEDDDDVESQKKLGVAGSFDIELER